MKATDCCRRERYYKHLFNTLYVTLICSFYITLQVVAKKKKKIQTNKKTVDNTHKTNTIYNDKTLQKWRKVLSELSYLLFSIIYIFIHHIMVAQQKNIIKN